MASHVITLHSELGLEPPLVRFTKLTIKLWNAITSLPVQRSLRRVMSVRHSLAAAAAGGVGGNYSWFLKVRKYFQTLGLDEYWQAFSPVPEHDLRLALGSLSSAYRNLEIIRLTERDPDAVPLAILDHNPNWYVDHLPADVGAKCLFLIRDGSFPSLSTIARKCHWPDELAICPACFHSRETTEHLLYHCPTYASLRQHYEAAVDSILIRENVAPDFIDSSIVTAISTGWPSTLSSLRCPRVAKLLSSVLLGFLRRLWIARRRYVVFPSSWCKAKHLSYV